MVKIYSYDAAGFGLDWRSGNFSVLPSDDVIVTSTQDYYYDYDTTRLYLEYNYGEFYASVLVDSLGWDIYSITDFTIFNQNNNVMFRIADWNLNFDINDDFSFGALFTNISYGNDTISGNRYADWIQLGSGNDIGYGNSGRDTIYGQTGNDTISGGNDSDWTYGGSGNDQLFGESGNDTIYGGSGSDQAYGGYGNDRLFGDSGNDGIYGGKGNDQSYGGYGNDWLAGHSGNDTFYGGNGGDRIYGGTGNDRLFGGAGSDRLSGGAGADLFVFTTLSDAGNSLRTRDTIADFQRGFDRIDLSGIDANASRAGNSAFKYIGTQAFSGSAGELRYFNGVVMGDTDGDARSDFQILVNSSTRLSSSDFIL